MKNYLFNGLLKYGFVIVCIPAITSCNKDLADPKPITFPVQGSQSALQYITSDTTFSYFLAAVTKAVPQAGVQTLLSLLGDPTTDFLTIFAPNNAAFRASGIPSVAAINSAAFRAGQLDSLLRYHIVPGEQWTTTNIPTTFPNIQLPSLLSVGGIPGTLLPFRLSVYPSRRATGLWINNIPVVATDKILMNGVLHTTAGLVTPPSLTLDSVIKSNANLTLFNAMISRADAGVTDVTKTIRYVLALPFANLTVHAPDNNAVKAFINAASGGLVPLAAPDAVFLGFIGANLPQASAAGVVAYHGLVVKAFAINYPPTSTNSPTLINLQPPPASLHPGVNLQGFFTGPFADSIRVLGLPPSNGGIPATAKPRSNLDRNAINGVLHVINKVLLPQ